jgi:glycosyltransferase involved in cell wall biosynthesis
MKQQRPLLSFVLVCYNQEAFIEEAVRGALAQTYSPLEIIISDDCSSDRTFEIARKTVAGYAGPHDVKFNRNSTNLGIGGNVNRAMELCRGELVVLGDGDDISLPNRTEVTWRAWEESDRRATSICFAYTTISADGTELGPGGKRGDPNDQRPMKALEGDLFTFLSTRQPAVCGCSHAWSPSLFKYFGPLKSDLEDLMMSFRSLAIGQILYVQQPLVKYRRHGRNVSFFAPEEGRRSFVERETRLRWVDEQTVRAYENMLSDIDRMYRDGLIGSSQRDRLRKEGNRVRTIYVAEKQMMDGTTREKLRTLTGLALRGRLKSAARLAPRLLPKSLYQNLYEVRNKIALARRRAEAARTNGATNI